MNPAAIPLAIEYDRTIIIIVANPEAAALKSCQSTLDNCVAINTPTITKVGATTGDKNNVSLTGIEATTDNNGENNVESKNSNPTTTEESPVLPPAATPLEDSTKLVTLEVP